MDKGILLVRLHKEQPDGTTVGESARTCHLVPVPNPNAMPDFLVAHCGLRIGPGAGEFLASITGMPCEECMALSSRPMFGMLSDTPSDSDHLELEAAARTDNGAGVSTATGETHSDARVSVESSAKVTITAQCAVNNPTIYINHGTDNEYVDFAVSGPDNIEILAHLQFTSPLEIITAGHNLVNAGLSLAKTLGLDIHELEAATPAAWWIRDRFESGAEE